METANNFLANPNISRPAQVDLTIFSDRVTCSYCQEVIFRSTQNRNYLLYPGHITTPLNIRANGGPYYDGEYADPDMVMRVLSKVK